MTATHDYSKGKRGWGHDYSVFESRDGGRYLRLMGHGCNGANCRGDEPEPIGPDRPIVLTKPSCRIEAGDYLILQNGDGSTRYRVKTIEYKRDPKDMWEAEVVFEPRPAEPA